MVRAFSRRSGVCHCLPVTEATRTANLGDGGDREEWVVKVSLGFELPAELLGSRTARLDPKDPKTELESVA